MRDHEPTAFDRYRYRGLELLWTQERRISWHDTLTDARGEVRTLSELCELFERLHVHVRPTGDDAPVVA